MRVTVSLVLGSLLAAPAHAGELSLNIEIPRINAAEYHRPYVAVWIEGAEQKSLADLAVWYQQTDGKEGHGTKWLPDLRQWWRKSGRALKVPVDGVTGPTRPVGRHALNIDEKNPALAKLPAGHYTLVVEAVREVGGRELLKIPFEWKGKPSSGSAQGQAELGKVTLSTKS
ncbi:MAG: DUF2271 domain-containing protein [Lysobacteraceae bacterium]|nr:MAG: DUF2271 domain-containing protein [Xanthomonadaceae bacterium]